MDPAIHLRGDPMVGCQAASIHDSARKSAKLVKDTREIYYPCAPHGLTATPQDQVDADLLTFVRSYLVHITSH